MAAAARSLEDIKRELKHAEMRLEEEQFVEKSLEEELVELGKKMQHAEQAAAREKERLEAKRKENSATARMNVLHRWGIVAQGALTQALVKDRGRAGNVERQQGRARSPIQSMSDAIGDSNAITVAARANPELLRKIQMRDALQVEVAELKRHLDARGGYSSTSAGSTSCSVTESSAPASASTSTQSTPRATPSSTVASVTQVGKVADALQMAPQPQPASPKPNPLPVSKGAPPARPKAVGPPLRIPPKAAAKPKAKASNGFVNVDWKEALPLTEEVRVGDLHSDQLLGPLSKLLVAFAEPSAKELSLRPVAGSVFEDCHGVAALSETQLSQWFGTSQNTLKRGLSCGVSSSVGSCKSVVRAGAGGNSSGVGVGAGTIIAQGVVGVSTLPRQQLLDDGLLKNVSILSQRMRMKHNGGQLDVVADVESIALRCIDTPEMTLEALLDAVSRHQDGGSPVSEFVKAHGIVALQSCEPHDEHRLIYEICRIDSVQNRLQCLLFKATWAEAAKKCQADLNVLYQALRVLVDKSNVMRIFFHTALRHGNALNQGSSAPVSSYGFRLDSLLKFFQLKSSVPPATMGHFVLAVMNVEDVDKLCSGRSMLSDAKNIKSYGVYERCRELLEEHGKVRQRSTSVAKQRLLTGEVDPSDHFHDGINTFLECSHGQAHDIARLWLSVFHTYKDLADFFDDPGYVYPPPQKKGDSTTTETEDMFDLFFRFTLTVEAAAADIRKARLREDILSGLAGTRLTAAAAPTAPGARQVLACGDGVVVRRLRDAVEPSSEDDGRQSDVSDWAETPRSRQFVSQRRRNQFAPPTDVPRTPSQGSRATSPATSPERSPLKSALLSRSPAKSPCKRVMILPIKPSSKPPNPLCAPSADGGSTDASGFMTQFHLDSAANKASADAAGDLSPMPPPPPRLPMLTHARRRSLSAVADRAQKDGLKKLGMPCDTDEDDDDNDCEQSPLRQRRQSGPFPVHQQGPSSLSRKARRDQQQLPLPSSDQDEDERLASPVRPRRRARKALTPVAEPGETPYKSRQRQEGSATPNSQREPMRRLDSFSSCSPSKPSPPSDRVLLRRFDSAE